MSAHVGAATIQSPAVVRAAQECALASDMWTAMFQVYDCDPSAAPSDVWLHIADQCGAELLRAENALRAALEAAQFNQPQPTPKE